MMEKSISVVVAVYNGEKYIERCIDSIINQEFKNLEIIIIDDGSQDETENLCKKYLGIQNLKYIKVQNGGCSKARNIGIENALGEYIVFVDADDYLEKNMYKDMYRCAIENNADIVVSGFKKVRENRELEDVLIPQKSDYMESFFKLIAKDDDSFYPVWNKLYKRAILIEKKIKFPLDTHMGEDIVFNYKMFYFSSIVSVCREATYNYFLNTQGVTQNSAKRGDVYKSFSHILEFIKEQKIQNDAKDSFNHLFY
ncbi:MAG: glycosyltransferase family 2 protein, partial [Fusobacteriaceae bacterium]